ncbi:LicD family protein [Roseovarius aquimarinus]|uniref:LicD family protein n=1 Tax=Roseovarius aquimarinus TaxID=1229156 RepID=A0ABW7I6H3_9RHOB
MLLGHSYLPDAFKTADHEAVWSQVGDAIASLEAFSPHVFLNSGTLLGAVRDGKLIDHDDDVDLAVLIDAQNEEEAGRVWRRMCEEMAAQGMLDSSKERDMAQVQLKTGGQTTIDVFPGWIDRGRVYVYPHTYGTLDEADLLPLGTCRITGLKIPAHPEKMLAVNYGDGWQKPDP